VQSNDKNMSANYVIEPFEDENVKKKANLTVEETT